MGKKTDLISDSWILPIQEAADIVNTIVDTYISMQSHRKRSTERRC